MFSVIQIGSTQYIVQEKDEILVDRMDLEEGKNFMAPKVLLFAESDDKGVKVGMPTLDNIKVELRVMGHERGKKVRVFKMKPKKHYQRTIGHRSDFTRLKVLKISVLNGSAKAAKVAEESAVEVKKEVVKKPVVKKAVVKKTTVKKTAVKKAKAE
ncbi:MAG: 50S ribosomal protein L21 [Candidatus Gracilibacteria bacterium]